MIRIEGSYTQRVPEDTGSLSEMNTMFSLIYSCFGRVPFKFLSFFKPVEKVDEFDLPDAGGYQSQKAGGAALSQPAAL